MVTGALNACQPTASGTVGGTVGGSDTGYRYPSLRTVPSEPRPSASVEERRRIVEGLIQDRDASLRQTGIVRRRSGLSAGAPENLSGPGWRAEEIVPEGAVGEGDGFRLNAEDEVGADSVYRADTRYEDGSLNDFIRRLKRDTNPPAPDEFDEPETELPTSEDDRDKDDEVSFFLPSSKLDGLPPLLIEGFAPVLKARSVARQDTVIRLAANGEDDRSIFCTWPVDMMISWLGVCVDGTEPPADDSGDTSAGVEGGKGGSDSDGGTDGNASSGGTGAGRKLTEQQVEEAIEDSGEGMLTPMTKSLAKLREIVGVNPNRSDDTSSRAGRPAYRANGSTARDSAAIGPPLPKARPERIEDRVIADLGETFRFDRTPTPHFRPSRVEIVPEATKAAPGSDASDGGGEPDGAGEKETPKEEDEKSPDEPEEVPPAKLPAGAEPGNEDASGTGKPVTTPDLAPDPAPALQEQDSPEPEETDFTERTPAPADTEPAAPSPSLDAAAPAVPEAPAMRERPSIDDPGIPSGPYVIDFPPGTDALSRASKVELIAILAKARAFDRHILIIGEAGTDYLARDRARIVGLELIDLGAMTEVLDYDHEAIAGVDRVRLILEPAEPDPSPSEAGSTGAEG